MPIDLDLINSYNFKPNNNTDKKSLKIGNSGENNAKEFPDFSADFLYSV